MVKIAQLRLKAANLQGKECFADVVQSQNRMAGSAARVLGFLQDLATRTTTKAKEEHTKLEAFAKQEFGFDMQPHDTAFGIVIAFVAFPNFLAPASPFTHLSTHLSTAVFSAGCHGVESSGP